MLSHVLVYRKIPNISNEPIEIRKHFLVGLSKYRGFINALMFIHYPNYTPRIPNVGPRLIFWGLIFGRIFGLVYWGPIFRGLYSEFYGI